MAIISSSVVVPWTPPTACITRAGLARREVTAKGFYRDTIQLNASLRESITIKAVWRQCRPESEK